MGLFRKRIKLEVKSKWTPSPEEQTWTEMRNDAVYQRLLKENASNHEEIAAEYTMLNTIGSFTGPQADKLIQKCVAATTTIEMLFPYYKKYNQPLPTVSEIHKRLAMIYEKQGRYEEAALACVQAIRLGMTDDGTKGGMRGRLAKMVKLGAIPMNKELESILSVK